MTIIRNKIYIYIYFCLFLFYLFLTLIEKIIDPQSSRWKTNQTKHEPFRCKAQTSPREGAVVLPFLELSGIQSMRAVWERLSPTWPRRRHLHSCCWWWQAQLIPSSGKSGEAQGCFSCYRNISDTCTQSNGQIYSLFFFLKKCYNGIHFRWIMDLSACLALTWVLESTDPGSSPCRITYTPSSNYSGKCDHFHSPLSQSWPAKTIIIAFFYSHYITGFHLPGYHNNIFVQLRSIKYGHELWEAVLWLGPSGSQYFCRHLYGNAAKLVLDVVLQKSDQTF